ncbi:RNA-binding protein 1-like [Amaranthus tricolor]|uniref:RNA-binding protein 1-like n=1 Tax=Amaranthus tricolor TaxID=29722 RepID=UPI00258B973D|nr:RNA-binding protein 1-like [Amaranthus tricolor]XP_057546620.1 RNA-binding protein 1-like [Amaranthus tricolor]
MSDAQWRYTDSRQQPAAPLVGKRPRSDYDIPSGHDMIGYYPQEDNRLTQHAVRDTEAINQSYDHYLQSGQAYPGADLSRLPGSGVSGHVVHDPRMGSDPRISGDPRIVSDPRMANFGIMDPGLSAKGQGSNLVSGRSEVPLPPDASSTLFVEGLPANCTSREVAHIFRPFVGYKEVRLVTKEARHSGSDLFVLCFVDFLSPAHAATALDALQGYKFDENDRESPYLRLQFARYPARSGGGLRRKR